MSRPLSSGPGRSHARRAGCSARCAASRASRPSRRRGWSLPRLRTQSTTGRSGTVRGVRAGRTGTPGCRTPQPSAPPSQRRSRPPPAGSVHGVDYSLSQLVEVETVDVGPDSDEVRTGWQARTGFRSYRAKTTTPTVPVHCSADLAPDGVRDRHLAAGILGWQEVYRDRAAPGPTGAADEGAEHVPTSYRQGSPAQADRRTRPLRRRAFRIAWPARVDMRWRKPWRFARFLVFGW